MKQNLQWPARRVYPVMEVVVQTKQPLLLLLGVVRSLKLRTCVLCSAASFVQEMPEVCYATGLDGVGALLQ